MVTFYLSPGPQNVIMLWQLYEELKVNIKVKLEKRAYCPRQHCWPVPGPEKKNYKLEVAFTGSENCKYSPK